MNRQEHLLVIANEECTEIAQAIDKALRFGMNNHHPSNPNKTNEHHILEEYYQLQTVVNELISDGYMHDLSSDEIIRIQGNKRRAMREYMNRSREFGCLE